MTNKKMNDPFAAREAQKYENPIPSREFITDYIKDNGAISFKRLAMLWEFEDQQREALRRRLRAMERDGQLIRNRRGAYCLMENMGMVKGRFSAHRDGYGFVIPEDGSDDIFINAREALAIFHDDDVLVRVVGINPRGKRDGVLVEVLERRTQQIVGRFFEENGVGFIEPAGKRIRKDILVPKEHRMGAGEGQFVVADIVHQPTRHSQAIGQIVEILGDHMAPGMEIDVAIRGYQIPNVWSVPVKKEVNTLPDQVLESDLEGRKDLRQLSFVTIDGVDAKDFDDAVFCEPKKDGKWRLLVAIADVSHYVKPGMALGSEAHRRGNSVYFPGRVIPMLPEKLSNGLCSLNPHVDRLCMVADMTIDGTGSIRRSAFYTAVIHSHARLTYDRVGDYIEGRAHDIDPAIQPGLDHLNALYGVLRQAREQRGALELDTVETQMIFGEHKKIEKIIPAERNSAHRLIEECMLCANVAAARFVKRHKAVSLYRVHEPPGLEKVEKLRTFVRELGIPFTRAAEPTPKDYAQLLEQIHDRPDRHIIQTVLLRTLSQAKYSPDNSGHFGLAYKEYAHFTSPIRRYPDLLLHRVIKSILAKETISDNVKQMGAVGDHCSTTERRADEATRDAIEWLKCEYMMDKVGDTFDGVISSVAGFGLFVELSDIYVEGLIHVQSLAQDYFQHDAIHHALRGERTGTTYQLGDSVKVLVEHVNLDDRRIDFKLILPEKKTKKKKHAKK